MLHYFTWESLQGSPSRHYWESSLFSCLFQEETLCLFDIICSSWRGGGGGVTGSAPVEQRPSYSPPQYADDVVLFLCAFEKMIFLHLYLASFTTWLPAWTLTLVSLLLSLPPTTTPSSTPVEQEQHIIQVSLSFLSHHHSASCQMVVLHLAHQIFHSREKLDFNLLFDDDDKFYPRLADCC